MGAIGITFHSLFYTCVISNFVIVSNYLFIQTLMNVSQIPVFMASVKMETTTTSVSVNQVTQAFTVRLVSIK